MSAAPKQPVAVEVQPTEMTQKPSADGQSGRLKEFISQCRRAGVFNAEMSDMVDEDLVLSKHHIDYQLVLREWQTLLNREHSDSATSEVDRLREIWWAALSSKNIFFNHRSRHTSFRLTQPDSDNVLYSRGDRFEAVHVRDGCITILRLRQVF